LGAKRFPRATSAAKMLSEHFVASIAAPVKTTSTSAKDIGIFQYQWQPLVSQDCTFKKSATPKNCLAVSETHIFAAQADKAAVHVYNREKNNQEAFVPFPVMISSLALAANDSVLVLGTADGRILLWEVSKRYIEDFLIDLTLIRSAPVG
jgi:pre-rRNA-processing protein IPI3